MDTTHCITDSQWMRFADGTLGESEKLALLKHIGQCEVCADIADGILSMPNPGVLQQRVKSIDAKVDRLTKSQQHRTPVLWYWSAAAVVLLGVGLVWMVLQRPPENIVSQNPVVTQPKTDSNTTPADNKPAKTSEVPVIADNTRTTKWVAPKRDEENATTENVKVPENNAGEAVSEQEDVVESASGKGAVNTRADSVVVQQTTPPAPAVAEKKVVTADKRAATEADEAVAASNKQTRKAEAVSKSKRKKTESNPAPSNANNNSNYNVDTYDDASNKDANNAASVMADSLRLVSAKRFYEEKKFAQCLASLTDVINHTQSPYYEEALLWDAKALVGLNRKADAKTILNKIIGLNGKWKAEAEALLNTL